MNEVPANVLAEYEKMDMWTKCEIRSLVRNSGLSSQCLVYAINLAAKEEAHRLRIDDAFGFRIGETDRWPM